MGEWLAAALLAHGETAQIFAYFGALLICGMLEMRFATNAALSRRRTRWPANVALTAVNLAGLVALPATVLTVSIFAASRGWGLLNAFELPVWAMLAAGFGLRSLLAYAVHRLMHKVPLFWRLHRIHHSDTAMDITTTIRVHPLEFAVTIPLHMIGVMALGISPAATLLYEIVDAGQTVVTHGNFKLPRRLDAALRWLLVTPDMHRMHHSSRRPEADSNYGTTVAVWDHLFGTYTMRERGELAAMPLGLPDSRNGRPDSLLWLFVLPFSGPVRGAGRARSRALWARAAYSASERKT